METINDRIRRIKQWETFVACVRPAQLICNAVTTLTCIVGAGVVGVMDNAGGRDKNLSFFSRFSQDRERAEGIE